MQNLQLFCTNLCIYWKYNNTLCKKLNKTGLHRSNSPSQGYLNLTGKVKIKYQYINIKLLKCHFKGEKMFFKTYFYIIFLL